jgi:hypothetical protein
MKDETIEIIKKMAIKYSVVNVDGSTSFTFSGNLKTRGKSYDNPKVTIDNEIADKIVSENNEHDAIETIKNELDVVS